MISIIIPAYNCSHCIEKTLDSLLAQTYKSFEIIIINDGSADNTDEIIRKYMDQHSDVSIAYQVTANGGPGSARNHGLSKAHGDYVVFVDSDDMVCPSYLETLYNGIINDVDFCFGSYYRVVDGNESEKYIMMNELYGIHSAEEVFVSFFSNKTYISLWNSIFSNTIISDNNLRFIDGCYSGEDVEFIARYLMCCKNVRSLKENIYTFYFDSKRAAKRQKKESTARIQDSVFWSLVEETEKYNWIEGKKTLEHGKLPIECFMKVIVFAQTCDTYSAFYEKSLALKNDYDYIHKLNKKYVKKSTYFKARLAMILLNVFPRVFYRIMNIKHR